VEFTIGSKEVPGEKNCDKRNNNNNRYEVTKLVIRIQNFDRKTRREERDYLKDVDVNGGCYDGP
jgi:hypothetical protein